MLKTVEEIEAEILKLLVDHEQDLETTNERMDFIIEQGKAKLEEYEKTLDAHYADYEEEEYKEEYMKAYKEAKQKILESTRKLLDKEASETLKMIQE